MTFRGAEVSEPAGDDRPWTRGEQRAFERSLREGLDRLAGEVATARRQVAWLLGGLAVVAFLTGPAVAIILSTTR